MSLFAKILDELRESSQNLKKSIENYKRKRALTKYGEEKILEKEKPTPLKRRLRRILILTLVVFYLITPVAFYFTVEYIKERLKKNEVKVDFNPSLSNSSIAQSSTESERTSAKEAKDHPSKSHMPSEMVEKKKEPAQQSAKDLKKVSSKKVEKKPKISVTKKMTKGDNLKNHRQEASPGEIVRNEATPNLLRDEALLRNILFQAEKAREEQRFEESLALYQRYIKVKRDPDVMNNYGSVLLILGRYREAEKVFDEALKLKRDEIIELNKVASMLMSNKKTEACSILQNRQFPSHLHERVRALLEYCKN